MHYEFLLAALEQAELGRGFCAPNPSVGAVAVANGNIIARAYHRGAGNPHAEQLLLQELPPNISNVSLYVTLEPCNHWGRTPPCVDAIIHSGVKEVIYAYQDPNPVVAANNTPEILKKHEINVLHYPLPEIETFYQSYRQWTLTKKPWITAKIAHSFDGKIAGIGGRPLQITNALCSEYTHQQRKRSDVILTTARTVNNDDPQLNVRLKENVWQKPIAILDSRGELNRHAKILQSGAPCYVFHQEGLTALPKHANGSYYPTPEKKGLLDLQAVVNHLGQLGFHDVWVEAGGKLFNELHANGLVNQSLIYIAPKILGSDAVSAYEGSDLFNKACDVKWLPMGDNMIVSLDWKIWETSCLPA